MISLRRLWRWKIIERYPNPIEQDGFPFKNLSIAYHLSCRQLRWCFPSILRDDCLCSVVDVGGRKRNKPEASKKSDSIPQLKHYIRVERVLWHGLNVQFCCVNFNRHDPERWAMTPMSKGTSRWSLNCRNQWFWALFVSSPQEPIDDLNLFIAGGRMTKKRKLVSQVYRLVILV